MGLRGAEGQQRRRQPRHAAGARLADRPPRLAARAPGCDRVRRAGPAGRASTGRDVMTFDSGNGGVLRRTEGRGRLYESIIDTVGDTPVVRINRLAPAHVALYVKCEFFNPAASVKDRLALNIIEAAERDGHAEARPDRGRGDQRQHRHRPRDGLRRQGLSAGRDHGRQLLDRAAAADALPRRQGGADAAGAEGPRHVHEGEGARREARLVPGAPVRDPGQRRHPREHDGARRSSPTSRAGGSTISSPATAPAARSRASAGC